MEPPGDLDRHLLCPDRLDSHGRERGGRRPAQKGAFRHAIGRSRGGRTTKIHALTDEQGRPRAFQLTPGNAHDLDGARTLLSIVPCPLRLIADRSYDPRSLRDWL